MLVSSVDFQCLLTPVIPVNGPLQEKYDGLQLAYPSNYPEHPRQLPLLQLHVRPCMISFFKEALSTPRLSDEVGLLSELFFLLEFKITLVPWRCDNDFREVRIDKLIFCSNDRLQRMSILSILKPSSLNLWWLFQSTVGNVN